MDNKITSLKEVKPGMVVEVRKQNGTTIPCLVVKDEEEKLILSGYNIWCDLESFDNSPAYTCMGHTISRIFDVREGDNSLEVSKFYRKILWSIDNIDYSKLKTDDIVYVLINEEYLPRHFARYKNGNVYVWASGRSSKTAHSNADVNCYTPCVVRLGKQ